MSSTPINVLLVEDSPTDVFLVQEAVAMAATTPLNLTPVCRLGEALDRLAQESFDLVLLDLGLPDCQGLDTFSRLHARVSGIPIVVLTGQDDELLASQTLRAGAQDYLVKGQVESHALTRAIRNATERKRTDNVLRDREERFRLAVDAAQMAVWDWAISTDALVWSGHVQQAFDLPASFAAFLQLVHPDDRERVRRAIQSTIGRQPMPSMEFRVAGRHGEVRWVANEGRPYVDDADQPSRMIGVLFDVTERREIEQALRDSETRYRLLAENATDMISLQTAEGTFLYVSPASRVLYGRGPDELVSRSFFDFVHPEDLIAMQEDRARLLAQPEGVTSTCRIIRKDGSSVWIEITARPLPSVATGNRPELICVARDISERRHLEERLQAENVYLQEEIKLKHKYEEIVGQSVPIQKVLRQVDQVASTGSTVLILGETGTGKELLARAIHDRSPRSKRPMVMLNCAALPTTLVESELFGREKGAYTGAMTRQPGRFELADGSTLFLDEIGELPLEAQAKFLRVLQEGKFERLGGTQSIKTDVRILAATNRNLETAVKEGRFRSDLYYRLNVFPIRLPPLRERLEDIPLLVWAFVNEFSRSMGKSINSVARSSLDALYQHAWPGNCRELRNVIEHAMIVCQSDTLRIELPARDRMTTEEPLAQTLEEVERRHIMSVLEATGWRVSGNQGAAEILGLKPTTLEARMAKLGIRRPQR